MSRRRSTRWPALERRRSRFQVATKKTCIAIVVRQVQRAYRNTGASSGIGHAAAYSRQAHVSREDQGKSLFGCVIGFDGIASGELTRELTFQARRFEGEPRNGSPSCSPLGKRTRLRQISSISSISLSVC